MDDAPLDLKSLGLTLGRGRRHKAVRADFVRELTVEDLVGTGTQEAGTQSPAIKELRQSHHMLARVIAQGLPMAEVAIITGYSISRISILKSDPMFQELLAHYSDMDKQQYAVARADMHDRLASLGFDAVEVLHARLLDDPESLDNKMLLAITEATADRTGYGKTSTVQTHVTHSLSSESIARLKAETSEGREVAQEDRDALLRLAAERTAAVLADAQEVDWEPGAGPSIREEADPAPEGEVAEERVGVSPLD